MHAPNLANRYFRHAIHCKGCSGALKAFNVCKKALPAISLALTAFAILVSGRQWKAACPLGFSKLMLGRSLHMLNSYQNEHSKLHKNT
ncbi:hypothetical protein OIU84_009769 [Salix udensis]|uniref:Uncharacterized protein n=1 Tax=Salix udensis TaxID=889485 RepID=A0AAD6JL89_9ROSI|nr:hypothetical protein OIU84_009769 [Salix udensis]